ncbi:MAG TPA: carbohydrate porin [Rhodanobacteraceae bacterium]|nr:carbohydrate porin [Rhodanobacteraceae bacterium]
MSLAAHAAPGDTTFGGKMFFDFTHIDQTNSDTGDTDASGTGLDVKRFYLQVDHAFDDIWSATLVTDFNYVGNDSETQVFVKKAYVQGKFDRAAVLRVGSADMPWIPFVENWYGFRYVENTLVDRLKIGNSADWGLHLGGDVGASQSFDYAVSAVNGAGYKNPGRGKGVDVEGRVGFAPMDGMIVALGGYSGKRGMETETVDAFNTASRADLMVAYAGKRVRLGAEYFQARNWNSVLTPETDKADGASLWGSVGVSDSMTVFARYDKADLGKDLDPDAKDTYYNAGIEFRINKGFKLAAVYKHERRTGRADAPLPIHVADTVTNEFGVWGEVKF